MAERPLGVDLLYALGDGVLALLVCVTLVVPLVVPAVVWWVRR